MVTYLSHTYAACLKVLSLPLRPKADTLSMSSLYHGSSLNFSMNFSTIHPSQMLLRSLAFLFLLFSGIQVALARPMHRPPGTDIGFSIIKSQHMADVGLRFVADSGVCETTPGVHQMSGYIDVGENMSTVRPTRHLSAATLEFY